MSLVYTEKNVNFSDMRYNKSSDTGNHGQQAYSSHSATRALIAWAFTEIAMKECMCLPLSDASRTNPMEGWSQLARRGRLCGGGDAVNGGESNERVEPDSIHGFEIHVQVGIRLAA